MKRIGLIGGLTWESSIEYYRIINEMVYEKLGGRNSADIIMGSFNFEEIDKLMTADKWDEIGDKLVKMGVSLERAGADGILICCNTAHKVAEQVKKSISVPLIDIVDVISAEINERGLKIVGLLGSIYTMEKRFYRDKLRQNGIETVIPSPEDRQYIMEVINKELGIGVINDSSRKRFVDIFNKLNTKGAQGIILGCTEIPLLVQQKHTDLPLFDSTYIHARAAVRFSLPGKNI